MPEVLHLEYHASSGSTVRVVVDAVETFVSKGVTRTGVLLGQPPIERTFTLAKLKEIDAQLVADLQSVLARLEPITRTKAETDAAHPDRMREEANRIARERHELAKAKEAEEAKIDELKVEAKRMEIMMQAAAQEHAEKMRQLDHELLERRAAQIATMGPPAHSPATDTTSSSKT